MFFATLALQAQTIDVRLFSNKTLTQSWLSTYDGQFYLLALRADGEVIDTVADVDEHSGNRLHVQWANGQVKVKQGESSYGTFQSLKLVNRNGKGHFIIKGVGRERIYTGQLIFKPRKSDLLVVNRVPLNEYVAGVVESEGGHHQQMEYFKAQAVLARTWVLKNMNKHIKEGYNVKDDVTSQAYYSKAYLQYSTDIDRAVRETGDTILVDEKGKPIFGAFHANSGGYTVNSEDYWSGKISYLRAVEDTFSLKMEKAYWTKEIDKATFLKFFAGKLGYSISDTAFTRAVLQFKQEPRQAYFTYGGKSLKLRAVRQQFKLRSTYFNVEERGDKVILHGRGFGHGVGMSQEGAMRMAELGYSYKDILMFYFKGVRLNAMKK